MRWRTVRSIRFIRLHLSGVSVPEREFLRRDYRNRRQEILLESIEIHWILRECLLRDMDLKKWKELGKEYEMEELSGT